MFISMIVLSVVLAIVIMGFVSKGKEIGCSMMVVPIISFGVWGFINCILLFTTGDNWLEYVATDGNCWRFQDCEKVPYPYTCKLPYRWMDSKYCIKAD